MESSKTRFIILLAVTLIVMASGTIGFSIIEDLSLWDSFYFTIVTIATVGYGDISPSTTAGKLLGIFLIFGGVATFLGVISGAIEMVVSHREKNLRQQKLNMIAGLFFSEFGIKILDSISRFIVHAGDLKSELAFDMQSGDDDFDRAALVLENIHFEVDASAGDLAELRRRLQSAGSLFVRLMENPILLEHGSFTELLRALGHLRDELAARGKLDSLPPSDLEHLAGDIRRAFRPLAVQWLVYLKHLRAQYPYLYSYAIRANPFNDSASIVFND